MGVLDCVLDCEFPCGALRILWYLDLPWNVKWDTHFFGGDD